MPKLSRTAALAVLVAAVGLAAGLAPASAESACEQSITASGRAANPQNYDPPKHYNPETLAKDRAIAKWRELVAAKCPHDSNFWWRARDRKVTCEGYAGGISCEASGTPAKHMGR